MRVAIGSDHAGFELKEAVKAFLVAENREVVDVGTSSKDPVDYSDYAEAVGAALRGHRAERGIILCGSGVGASMAANRIPGIRAGLCHDTYSAHQGVEHDDMNVLVLGGRVVGIELAHELIRAFLNARFTGEARHLRRLAKVTALENPLRALQVFGQSVWFDYIRRSLITSGELRRLIDEDGLRGVTSNPAIFEKAVAGSSDYKDVLEAPESRTLDAKTLYERLAVRDIQDAADTLRPVYEQTSKRDGYVSLEVSPFLAFDTPGTLDEARRLWRAVETRESDDQGPRDIARAFPLFSSSSAKASMSMSRCCFRTTHTSKWPKRTSQDWSVLSQAAETRAAWPAWRASLSVALTPRSTRS